MFRCITELKGLAIDIDSFKDDELSDWAEIEQQYKCLFITSKEDTAEELEYLYDGCVTYILEGFKKCRKSGCSGRRNEISADRDSAGRGTVFGDKEISNQ